MRINWKGHGQKINHPYSLCWSRMPQGMYYSIRSMKTGICILSIYVPD